MAGITDLATQHHWLCHRIYRSVPFRVQRHKLGSVQAWDLKPIETKTQWSPFHRRYFHISFPVRELLYIDLNFAEMCSQWFKYRLGLERTTNHVLSQWWLSSKNATLNRDHYGDVIMGAIASQITSLTIVYSTVYSDADQRKHQCSASLAFVRGIHRGPVNSPHKWPVTRKMYPFDDVIMDAWSLEVQRDFNRRHFNCFSHGYSSLSKPRLGIHCYTQVRNVLCVGCKLVYLYVWYTCVYYVE